MSTSIGEQLKQGQRGEAKAAARALGVSVRTLSRWKRRAQRSEPAPRWGRPPHSEAATRRAEDLVTREREIQGRVAGWRPIEEALSRQGDLVPTKLVQRVLSLQKQAERKAERRRRREHRVSHDVLACDAVWAQDATDLGHGVHAEVAKDSASTSIRGLALGLAATAADVLALLEAMRRRNGGLPLVWQTDNGSAYTSQVVRDYLALHRVIHLRSRVRMPTDNPAIERGIGEIKAELGDDAPTPAQVARVCTRLDHGRLRASRGYRTAGELDATLPRACAQVDRERFYAEACLAIETALKSHETARARRKAERAAIWGLLEHFGLARTRGPACAASCPDREASSVAIR
jgi:transposase InsO family protein